MPTKVTNAGSLKSGSFVIVDGVACKVSDVTHSKSGKHGSAKCRITAIGLLDNRKRDIVMPCSDSVEVPIIDKCTAQVLSVSGDTANVMDMETYESFDLEIPDELKGQVQEGGQVLYWDILGEKVMKQSRGE